MQRTLKRQISIIGTGLHSGRPARLKLLPAAAGQGIWFRRADINDRNNMIAASWDLVSDTLLCTRITNEAGVSVATIEHLMAALAGLGVSNVIVELDGPEIPIMDGSARRFVSEILRVGLIEQDAPASIWQVMKPVRVESGAAWAELTPANAFVIDFDIEFAGTIIGHQARVLDMHNGAFIRELADCRTFCRRQDVDSMLARGLALGGNLENALVVNGMSYENPEGPRGVDECVRHKMLDALGDLALAGGPILGRYVGQRAGHALTNRLLRALFAQRDAWEIVECGIPAGRKLPGVGVLHSDIPVPC